MLPRKDSDEKLPLLKKGATRSAKSLLLFKRKEELQKTKAKHMKHLSCGIATYPVVFLIPSIGPSLYAIYRFMPRGKEFSRQEFIKKWQASAYSTQPLSPNTPLTCNDILPYTFSIRDGCEYYDQELQRPFPSECQIDNRFRNIVNENFDALLNTTHTCRDVFLRNTTNINYCHIETIFAPEDAAQSYCLNYIHAMIWRGHKCEDLMSYNQTLLASLHPIDHFPVSLSNKTCQEILPLKQDDCNALSVSVHDAHSSDNPPLFCSLYMPPACEEEQKENDFYNKPLPSLDDLTCADYYISPEVIRSCWRLEIDALSGIKLPGNNCNENNFILAMVGVPFGIIVLIILISILNNRFGCQPTCITKTSDLPDDEKGTLGLLLPESDLSDTIAINILSLLNEKIEKVANEIKEEDVRRKRLYTFLCGFSDKNKDSNLYPYKKSLGELIIKKILFFAEVLDEAPPEHDTRDNFNRLGQFMV